MPYVLHLNETLAFLLPFGNGRRKAALRKSGDERREETRMEPWPSGGLRLFVDSIAYSLALLQNDSTLSAHQRRYLHAVDTQVSDLRDLMSRLQVMRHNQHGSDVRLQSEGKRPFFPGFVELAEDWSNTTVVDENSFLFIKSRLPPARLGEHLKELRRRILLAATQICNPAKYTPEEHFDAKHDLVGLGGALGFMELAYAMRGALHDPAVQDSNLLSISLRSLNEIQARLTSLEPGI